MKCSFSSSGSRMPTLFPLSSYSPYIQARNYNTSRNYVRKSFYKRLFSSTFLWSRAWLFLVSMKGQKRDKSEFVTKFVGVMVMIIDIEISLKFLVKSLLVFFHWSLETQNLEQNNLQSALTNSSPTMCTLVEELSNNYEFFEVFRISWFIWWRIFDSF